MHEERSAFARGPRERPLRVVIDRETAIKDEALQLLLELAGREHVELFSTSPDDEKALRIEIDPIDRSEDMAPVRIHRAESFSHRAVIFAHQYEEMARASAAAGETSEEDALRALLLAAAAYDLGADALVTGSPVLLSGEHGEFIARSNPLPSTVAAALAGLFLRLRADFAYVSVQGLNEAVSPWLFYWIVTRDLLPAGWRWLSGCSDQTRNEIAMADLAGSALERFSRALRARDHLHEQVRLSATNETNDVAVFYFDVVLLMLTAAFDIAAHVAHLVYELPPKTYRSATWRRQWWRDDLRVAANPLAALMDKEQPARDALELAAILRNKIHGEALRAVTFKRGGRPAETMIELPSPVVDDLRVAASRLGGEADWGFRASGPRTYIEPDQYVEALLPAVASGLNDLMAATEVERLGAPKVVRSAGAPDEWPWDEDTRLRLRLLAGVAST
ncbi:MAG: hypothetical protein ACJ79O_26915 [Myxococcales bacterium]